MDGCIGGYMTKAEIALRVKTKPGGRHHLYDKEVRYLYGHYTVPQLREMVKPVPKPNVHKANQKAIAEMERGLDASMERDALWEEANSKGLKPHPNLGIKKLKKLLGEE